MSMRSSFQNTIHNLEEKVPAKDSRLLQMSPVSVPNQQNFNSMLRRPPSHTGNRKFETPYPMHQVQNPSLHHPHLAAQPLRKAWEHSLSLVSKYPTHCPYYPQQDTLETSLINLKASHEGMSLFLLLL